MILVAPDKPTLRYRAWSKLVTLFGHSYLAFKPQKVRGWHLRDLLRTVEPGDVLFRTMFWSLSWFIPGRYVHSGLVEDSEYLIHAVASNVCRNDILDFGLGQDKMCLFRPRYASERARTSAIHQARDFLGAKYDFRFLLEDGKQIQRPQAADGTCLLPPVYCHELTWRCLREAGVTCGVPKRIYADTILACPGDVIMEVP